jgi:hypothetical protein
MLSSTTPRQTMRASSGRDALTTTAFFVGDALFLAFVGAIAAAVMFFAHLWIPHGVWNFIVAMTIGMIAAMIAQMVMAFSAAPLLGSIESMVPSMLVGMAAPMIVCAAHILGWEWSFIGACLAGSLIGATIFTAITIYSIQCHARLRCMAERLTGHTEAT